MSFAVSGATTLAAANTRAAYTISLNSPYYQTIHVGIYFTALTAGSNTFTAKYSSDASTSTFQDRQITVVGIP
jgi:hypothetical protein